MLLPINVWESVLFFLARDDVYNAVQCGTLSKAHWKLLKNEMIWKSLCNYPTNSFFKTYRDLSPKYESWYRFYKEKASLKRVVSISKQSIHNPSYHCTINKIEFTPGKIKLHIDERGDNTMGPIQNPVSSTLMANGQPIKLLSMKFDVEDMNSQYRGQLNYEAEYVKDTKYSFSYGEWGYTVTELFVLTQDFINQYTLHQIIAKNLLHEKKPSQTETKGQSKQQRTVSSFLTKRKR